ncbi:MAG: translocation/assembly module TamB domain-containing protein [Gammaproteobacteria bacterium]|nr:translocation/assembly module TamB domain-containing protein [Gammaproteobacteria bacterium]
MKRWLLIALVVLLLIATLPFAALQSETLTRWVLPELLRFVPGKVEAVHESGALAGPIVLTDVRWRDGEREVTVSRIEFDWEPFALWTGDFSVLKLHTGTVGVDWPSGNEESSEPLDLERLLESLELPLAIQLRDIDIEALRIKQVGSFDSIGISAHIASIDNEQLRIDSLAVSRSGDRITLGATLEMAAPFATNAELDALLAGRPAVDGRDIHLQATARGNLRTLDINAELKDPASARLHGKLFNVLDGIRWQASLDIPRVSSDELPVLQPLQSLEAALQLDGNPQLTQASGSLQLRIADLDASIRPQLDIRPDGLRSRQTALAVPAYDAAARLDANLGWKDALSYSGTLFIDTLQLPLPEARRDQGRITDGRIAFHGDTNAANTTASLAASGGRLNLGATADFPSAEVDANVEWRDIRLPVGGKTLQLQEGQAEFSGKPSNYRFAVQGTFRHGDLPGGSLAVTGSGDRSTVQATIDSLQWLGGTAEGKSRLALETKQLSWSLDADGFNPQPFLATLPGKIGIEASGESVLSADGPHTFTLARLKGSLNSNELGGSGRLRIAGNRWEANDMRIAAGDATLAADGDSHGDGISIELRVAEIAAIDQRYGGSVVADGRWQRSEGDNWIELQAEGENLLLPNFSAARAEVDFNLDAAGERESSISLLLDDARIVGRGIEAARFDMNGTRAGNSASLSVQVADGQVQLSGNGEWLDNQWQGQLVGIELGARQAGAWRLAEGSGGPVPITLGTSTVKLDRFCLGREQARLCSALEWDGQYWQASADLERARLEYFGALLPAGLDYRGGFNFSAKAGNQPRLTASANLELRAGSVRAQREQEDDEEPPPLLEWYGGSANLGLADRQIDTDMTLDLGRSGRINGGGTIGVPADDSPAPLDINIQAALQRLELLAAIYPEVNRIQGQFGADLTVGGTTEDPRIEGSAELRNGSLQLARYGLQLEDIGMKLVGRGDDVELEAGMKSGEGRLEADLSLRERGGKLLAEGSMKGERFTVSNTRELKLLLSPDLELDADGREIVINGRLHVPRAIIEPRELSTGTVSASEDQVFVDAEASAEAERRDRIEVRADVRTTLGEEVSFSGFGLETDIEGNLRVIREPDSPARGEGRLALVNGRYRAYGQRLRLVRGELIYTGQPLTEPGLDIRAVREPAPDITVGVTLRGDLREPQLELYSDPSMTQQDQLSWLVLGRPASRDENDQTEINNAALALGLGGGALTGELKDRFDLEEATLQDVGDESKTSLVLGKYLSPDLYVSYGIGLFEAANSFRIRYRLSSKWTLEAVSGLENSADFLYTIESGR